MKWLRKNILIILLMLAAVLIWALPLFVFGIGKSFFYELDPDIVYVSNSMLYTTAKIIAYLDHPGTPSIVLLSYFFIPLRLISKYMLHQQFIQWAFDNYVFLTFYLRVFQVAVSAASLFVFLKAIKSFANSILFILVSFFFVVSFAGFSIAISPENFSLFLAALWLIFFAKFIKSPKYIFLALMALISGFALANKFTNLFLAIPAVLLPLLLRDEKLGRKLIFVESNIALLAEGFLIGIWPVWSKFSAIFNWGLTLFYHTDSYGGGLNKTFDWSSYSASSGKLIAGNPLVFIFILATVLLAIALILSRKVKIYDPAIFLTFTSLIGILIFMKYPLIRYQNVNILLLIFCFTYFLTKLKPLVVKAVVVISAVVFVFSSIANWNMTSGVISSNMAKNQNVYQILQTWTSFWSADVFRDQFAKLKKL